MKRFNKITPKVSIQSATKSGTKFYEIPLSTAIEVLQEAHENIILIHRLDQRGWNALNLEVGFWGSEVIDDTLYYCDTDGTEVEIEGQLYEPEEIISELGVDAIQSIIEPASADVIKRTITTYELGPLDLDKVAYSLLQEGYSFKQIVDAAEDANLLSD